MTKKDLYEFVLTSGEGSLGMLKNTFCFFDEYEFERNEFEELIKTNYVCSYIVSIRKYDDNRINIAFINLDDTYTGRSIDPSNLKYDWLYKTIEIKDIKKLKISENWRDLL